MNETLRAQLEIIRRLVKESVGENKGLLAENSSLEAHFNVVKKLCADMYTREDPYILPELILARLLPALWELAGQEKVGVYSKDDRGRLIAEISDALEIGVKRGAIDPSVADIELLEEAWVIVPSVMRKYVWRTSTGLKPYSVAHKAKE